MYDPRNYFPKNYHSTGIGLVNLAALGYNKNEQDGGGSSEPPKTGLYPALPYPTAPPDPSGVSLSYGMPTPPTQMPGYASSAAPYPPSPAAPYPPRQSLYPTLGPQPSQNLPYPTGMPQPFAPYSSAPYPTAYPTPYPPAAAPALPYPTTMPSGMPLPYSVPPPTSPSSLYPTIPTLPDGAMPTYGGGGGCLVSEAANEKLPSPEEEPSVGVPEIPFSAVQVPESENMFWMKEKTSESRPQDDSHVPYETLRGSCLDNGTLFEDPAFPANNDSLMFSRRPDRYIEWLRPHEITDDPQFFVDGYSRFDVQQGELGDCWLLAAAANLTSDPNLFFRVVPPDQNFEENYAGIFHFCFWQYGKWIEVVVDDRLPTYRGELIYMHSTERNEFWSALLEKAYAKLHGSYEALKGGTTCEAMEDFTGGVTEWYDLKEAPPNLFNILVKAMNRNSLMGCSLEPDPNVFEAETPQGLIRGHAYSISRVCMIDIHTPNRQGKLPMIRMRNPWGNDAEWNGPFSDNSAEWRYIPEHQKEELGLTFDADGEFWMPFQEFLNNFDRVEICNLSPDSLTEEQEDSGKRKWEMKMFEGEWTANVTAGGCRNFLETFWHNPQYVITLTDPDEDDDDGKCTVIVALMQKNRRSKRNRGMECLTIGFAIYHLTDRDMETRPQGLNFFKYRASVARSPHFINTREICARFKLPPGNYLIVPSTFDPNEEGEYIIRVFSETANVMDENDDSVGYCDVDDRIKPNIPPPREEDPQRENLRRLFKSIAGSDMEVDWMELKRILDHSLRDVMIDGNTFSKDACRSMVAMMDKDQSGNLGFDEFESLLTDIAKWKAVFKFYDRNHSGEIESFQLRDALNSAGYRLNNRVLNALGRRYTSREGKITFDDFLMCSVKTKTYIDIFRERQSDESNHATFSMDEWLERTAYS
ncbi:calpain-B [Ceratitis capitata]|nr:calpain-B [Ceratitis capitata]